MTQKQIDHLAQALAEFDVKATNKYVAGVKEHGGNLWDNDPLWLVDQAMQECIDQWMYLKTLRDKLIQRV